MPVVRTTQNHDDAFHHLQDVGEKVTTLHTPTEGGVRYQHLSNQSSPRRCDFIFNNTHGGPNGELNLRSICGATVLTFSTGFLGHPSPSRPRPSPRHRKRLSAREGNGEDYTNKLKAVPHHTLTEGVDDGRREPTQPSDTGSTKPHCDTGSISDETPVDAIPEPGSQEKFDEDVMIYYNAIEPSLASQFLNLDDQVSASVDQMAASGSQPTAALSSSLADTATGTSPEWEAEPTSFRLLDMHKFETLTDFDGGYKTVQWPWGDYRYQPSRLPGDLDPEECAEQYYRSQIEKMLREEITEIMAQEAIRAGEQEMKRKQQGGKKEEKRAERGGTRPDTVAVNDRVVHGRTIYSF